MKMRDDVRETHEYSTNACYENGKKNGGAKYNLMRSHVKDGDTSDDELLKMDFCPYRGISSRRGYITQTYSQLMNAAMNKVCHVIFIDDMSESEIQEWRIKNNDDKSIFIQPGQIQDYRRMYSDYDSIPSIIFTYWSEGVISPCKAKVYSICEHYKIRNITASNSLNYTLAKGMQKYMHGSLREFRQFALIGKALDTFFVNDFLNRGKTKWSKIASGDFSAATDNIKIQLTKLVFEAIMKNWLPHDVSENVKNVLRSVLYEHTIEYPKKSGLEPVVQKNGQLMGSVLSFPILCIINVITYWIAVAPEVTDFRELNVMVNGDDIMFQCDQRQYDNWLRTLPEAGLTPSPGKNFFHDKYGTVNSAMFYRQDDITHYVPFYNVGMLLGQSKVARVEEGRNKPVHCLHQAAMHGAENPIRADQRFKFYNLDQLTKASQTYDGVQLNWYLPRTMGGLGMQLPQGVDFVTEHEGSRKGHHVVLSDNQRIIAHGLRDAWYKDDLQKAPFKPIGLEVDPDLQSWGNDIKKRVVFKAQLKDCPMLPDCRDLKEACHEPNWYLPLTGDIDLENIKYMFQGLRLRRFAVKVQTSPGIKKGYNYSNDVLVRRIHGCNYEMKMLSKSNAHLYQELVLYEKCRDRRSVIKVEGPRLRVTGEVISCDNICDDFRSGKDEAIEPIPEYATTVEHLSTDWSYWMSNNN